MDLITGPPGFPLRWGVIYADWLHTLVLAGGVWGRSHTAGCTWERPKNRALYTAPSPREA